MLVSLGFQLGLETVGGHDTRQILSLYAHHFDEVWNILLEICVYLGSQLSIGRLRKLCDNKQDPSPSLLNH